MRAGLFHEKTGSSYRFRGNFSGRKRYRDFWSSLLAGKSGIGLTKTFDVSAFDSLIAGEVKDFDAARYFDFKEAKRMEKFAQYAAAASKEAVKDSGIDLTIEDLTQIGVLIGSGMGSLRMIEEQYKIYLEKGPFPDQPLYDTDDDCQ